MVQNINLIEGLNVQPMTFFNSIFMLKLSLIWIVLLFWVYMIGLWIDADRMNKVKKIEKTKSYLMEKVAYYEGDTPYRNLNIDLRDIHVGLVSRNGFYHYLKSLSEFVPVGVWLTKITLEPDDVVIKGKAIVAAGVSDLLDNLNKTEGFRDKKIEIFNLEQISGSNDKSFIVSTVDELKEAVKETE